MQMFLHLSKVVLIQYCVPTCNETSIVFISLSVGSSQLVLRVTQVCLSLTDNPLIRIEDNKTSISGLPDA